MKHPSDVSFEFVAKNTNETTSQITEPVRAIMNTAFNVGPSIPRAFDLNSAVVSVSATQKPAVVGAVNRRVGHLALRQPALKMRNDYPQEKSLCPECGVFKVQAVHIADLFLDSTSINKVL
jgi:hypothetical protein